MQEYDVSAKEFSLNTRLYMLIMSCYFHFMQIFQVQGIY